MSAFAVKSGNVGVRLRLAPEGIGVREDLKRDSDPVVLKGDSSAAYRDLGWQHTKSFAEMVQAMVDFDRELLADPEALWHEA